MQFLSANTTKAKQINNFAHKSIKKLPSKVTNNRLGWAVFSTYCQPAQNQSKSQILFHKNVSLPLGVRLAVKLWLAEKVKL